MNKILVMRNGGIGKVLDSTVAIRGLKKKFPDDSVIAIAGHADIYQNNPNISRYFNANQIPKYFPDDYVKEFIEDRWNIKGEIIDIDPYVDAEYISGSKHISQVWCEKLGLPFDNPKPDLFLSKKEIRLMKDYLAQKTKKPIMLIQSHGGPMTEPGKPVPKMFVRNLPTEIAQKVVEAFKDKFDIIHIRTPYQPKLEDTIPGFIENGLQKYILPIREVMCMTHFADKIVCIDSFLQHACAALGKQAVVLWGGTNPANLGYDSNINLSRQKACPVPYCTRPNSFIFDINWECEYEEKCMEFNPEEIIEAVKKSGNTPMETTPKIQADEVARKIKDSGATDADLDTFLKAIEKRKEKAEKCKDKCPEKTEA
jgi:ADP-heptose:LPS heptosyltransferase